MAMKRLLKQIAVSCFLGGYRRISELRKNDVSTILGSQKCFRQKKVYLNVYLTVERVVCAELPWIVGNNIQEYIQLRSGLMAQTSAL